MAYGFNAGAIGDALGKLPDQIEKWRRGPLERLVLENQAKLTGAQAEDYPAEREFRRQQMRDRLEGQRGLDAVTAIGLNRRAAGLGVQGDLANERLGGASEPMTPAAEGGELTPEEYKTEEPGPAGMRELRRMYGLPESASDAGGGLQPGAQYAAAAGPGGPASQYQQQEAKFQQMVKETTTEFSNMMRELQPYLQDKNRAVRLRATREYMNMKAAHQLAVIRTLSARAAALGFDMNFLSQKRRDATLVINQGLAEERFGETLPEPTP